MDIFHTCGRLSSTATSARLTTRSTLGEEKSTSERGFMRSLAFADIGRKTKAAKCKNIVVLYFPEKTQHTFVNESKKELTEMIILRDGVLDSYTVLHISLWKTQMHKQWRWEMIFHGLKAESNGDVKTYQSLLRDVVGVELRIHIPVRKQIVQTYDLNEVTSGISE